MKHLIKTKYWKCFRVYLIQHFTNLVSLRRPTPGTFQGRVGFKRKCPLLKFFSKWFSTLEIQV